MGSSLVERTGGSSGGLVGVVVGGVGGLGAGMLGRSTGVECVRKNDSSRSRWGVEVVWGEGMLSIERVVSSWGRELSVSEFGWGYSNSHSKEGFLSEDRTGAGAGAFSVIEPDSEFSTDAMGALLLQLTVALRCNRRWTSFGVKNVLHFFIGV